MKKALILAFAASVLGLAASGQNIVLGERVPDLHAAAWLDNRSPKPETFTYIEFFHTSSPAGLTTLDHLKRIAENPRTKISVVVATCEKTEKIEALLRPYLSERIAVAIDAARGFELFGVRYVPFGVLTDRKGRAVWMGNTLQFEEKHLSETTN